MLPAIELDALSRGALDLFRRPPHHLGMDRRRFLLTSLAGALIAPISAEAQPDKPVRLGVLSMTSGLDSVPIRTLKQRLGTSGTSRSAPSRSTSGAPRAASIIFPIWPRGWSRVGPP
jgi:hypothetical protein